MFKFYCISLIVLNTLFTYSQTKESYKIRTIAFYNVENLFDTINNPNTFDDDRTPTGKYAWSSQIYFDKIDKIGSVISTIGADIRKGAPDIIGLCEIENIAVLQDLINNTSMKINDYGIIHRDSRDERGIDVALLFKKKYFIPTYIKTYPLILKNDEGYLDFTRDVLVVTGLLDHEEIHFIINHWPSRRGGELRSRPNRIAAAYLNKKIIDSLRLLNIKAKIISMGDFNDGPHSVSFKKVLKTIPLKKSAIDTISLYNPMENIFRKGIGSLAYRDTWNLFDQLFFTYPFLEKNTASFRYWKAGIYNKDYLITPSGKYKGYPFRSYANGIYTGGYSDHFPVYLFLLKKVRNQSN